MAITHLAAGEGSHRWPQFLPDGRRFIFFSTLGRPDTQGVYIGSLDGGEPMRVVDGYTYRQHRWVERDGRWSREQARWDRTMKSTAP